MAKNRSRIRPPRSRALMAVHVAVLLFGLSGLFGKLISLPPLAIVFGRTTWASIALILYIRLRRQWQPLDTSDRGALVISGALLALHWFTFFESIRVSSVAVGLVTFSSFPLFVTFLEPLFFKSPLRRHDIMTVVLVMLGLLLVIPDYAFANRVTLGAFWGICSGASFAVLALLNRRFSKRNSALCIAAVQNTVAALVTLPFAWNAASHLSATDLVGLLFLGIICTALAHALFISGLARIRAQTASILAGLEPVYGITFAFLILGEQPALRTLLGGGLILVAVFLASLKDG